MINFVLFLILFVLCAGYYAIRQLEVRQSNTPLPKAEAGPVEGAKGESNTAKSFTFRHDFMVDGRIINPSKYIKLFVEGCCMKKRSIDDGDIILARKFDKSFDKSDIRPNDILLISLNDERYAGYKIRVFKRYNPENNDELETFYYNEDGSEHLSSKYHRINDIKGIVKYKVS